MNYIAYTIGPIYDTIFETLDKVHKTKRLKAGSYFFSLFMKKLLISIKDEFEILVPYIGDDALMKEHKMGLFHDRFIAMSQKSEKDIKDIFNVQLNKTFLELANDLGNENLAENLANNMDNHLIVASTEELKKINENIIFALNQILDAKELEKDFTFNIEKNYIKDYQDNEIKKSKVKTIEDISGDMKYYAVITADGDKIGEKIKLEATDTPGNIKHLSKKLFDFFTKDEDIYTITNKEFGGELIYAGGDDILAFVPIKYGNKTFLDYIATLDNRFQTIVGNDVSLSFGVNIAYVKYPLRDAINSAFDLLYRAKNSTANSVSLKLTKHSGQSFDTTMQIKSDKYTKYKELLDGILDENDIGVEREKSKITLPHSLHHSLKRYEQVILSIYDDDNKNASLNNMFTTVFNDTKKDSDRLGLKIVEDYIDICQPKTKVDFDDIFSELSLVKFLREDRK